MAKTVGTTGQTWDPCKGALTEIQITTAQEKAGKATCGAANCGKTLAVMKVHKDGRKTLGTLVMHGTLKGGKAKRKKATAKV